MSNFSVPKWGKLFPKNVYESRGYTLALCSGAFGPAGGGGVRERLPLVVSRTVGSARGADPISTVSINERSAIYCQMAEILT